MILSKTWLHSYQSWLIAYRNNRFIILITCVIAGALVGLVYLQYYWVELSYRTSRERFNQNVNQALTAVANTLVKNEALFTIRDQLRPDSVQRQESGFFDVVFDSSGTARSVEGRTIKTKHLVGSSSLSRQGQFYEVEQETKISRTSTVRKNELAGLNKEDLTEDYSYLKAHLDTVRMDSIAVENLVNKLKNSAIVVDVINSILNAKKKIEERVNERLLDSLIRLELRRKGIFQTYNFGVRNKSRESNTDRFIFTNNRQRQYQILSSPYYINLFPNDLVGERNILYLELPDAKVLVDQNLKGVLITSITLIAIIIGCFAYTLITLLRQKKLARLTKDFISNMTHEFKTPISTISLASEALCDPAISDMPIQRKRYLNIIREENARLAKQVEKVLQISQIERGDYKLKITNLDINALIEAASKSARILVEKREGSLKTELDPKQPVVEGDEHHISNILNNLIENANKYSIEKPQILITSQALERGVRITVSDKGIGIPRDMIGKIFDKFFRVPTGNRHDVKGFGLGLSYVKQMVEAHRGSIQVKSEIGKGSSFMIFLPYKHEQS